MACTTKHFPGGGPQKDGEDAHFPYGREQVYPGGRFDEHLEPFPAVIEAGTAAIMPYYGMPVGLEVDGVPIEEVGFGYNRQIVTGLLREQLGYDGVVLTDWELVNDNHVGDQVLPARAWGVEHLDPHRADGADPRTPVPTSSAARSASTCCSTSCAQGRVSEARIDESARRLLAVKFRLGLFDDPYVDEDAASRTVGRDDFRAAGYAAQARSVTVLTNGSRRWRPAPAPGARAAHLRRERRAGRRWRRHGIPVDRPEDADVALVRLMAPFEPRSDLFLESWFHQGSLDFPPGLVVRLQRIAAHCRLVVDVVLDRPAVLTPLLPVAAAVVGSYGTSDDALLDALTGVDPATGAAAVRPAALDGPGAGPPRGRARLRRPAVPVRPRADHLSRVQRPTDADAGRPLGGAAGVVPCGVLVRSALVGRPGVEVLGRQVGALGGLRDRRDGGVVAGPLGGVGEVVGGVGRGLLGLGGLGRGGALGLGGLSGRGVLGLGRLGGGGVLGVGGLVLELGRLLGGGVLDLDRLLLGGAGEVADLLGDRASAGCRSPRSPTGRDARCSCARP